MRNFTNLLLLVFLLFVSQFSFGQINVASTNGYAVSVTVLPVSVLPSASTCTWGYNYNLRLNYAVTFTGINRPASLYTLQGTIGCGSANHYFDLPNSPATGSTNTTSNQWNGNSDCNTATVSSLNCGMARIEISGLGINHQYVSFPVGFSVLPVGLTGFNARKVNNTVQVDWSTASEEGNDHFIIERSANATDWTAQQRIPGAGHSTAPLNYTWTDNSPLEGSNYYRLKQVDADGRFAFSEIKVVQHQPASSEISLYPIPAKGNIIYIQGINNPGKYSIRLLNLSGGSLYQSDLSGNSVTLPNIPAGIYVLELREKTSGTVNHLRYIKG